MAVCLAPCLSRRALCPGISRLLIQMFRRVFPPCDYGRDRVVRLSSAGKCGGADRAMRSDIDDFSAALH